MFQIRLCRMARRGYEARIQFTARSGLCFYFSTSRQRQAMHQRSTEFSFHHRFYVFEETFSTSRRPASRAFRIIPSDGTECSSRTAIPAYNVPVGLAPIVFAISRNARGAPVKIRPINAGIADAVIRTAFLVAFFDLIVGPNCPQGQYEKQTSRSMNLRVIALMLKKFTGAPITSADSIS